MMKGWLFERSREDAKFLLSKIGFAVSLPLAAAYLAVNPNQPISSSSSSSSVRAEAGSGGSAAVQYVSAGGGRHLKDEIHLQESEEVLAKIIHGDRSIANKDHDPCSKNLLDEEGFLLPPLMQLPLQRRESSLIRLTHDEFKANKVEIEQEVTNFQEKERSHLLDCYGSENKRLVVREIEDQLKISLMKAKCLSLKIRSLEEVNQLARIGELEYSEMINELESVVMIINCLIKALKSDQRKSGQRMAAVEHTIIMLDDKSDSVLKTDTNSKMMMEVLDEHTDLSTMNSSTELKNSESVKRLELGNVAPPCCSPKGQEVEEDLEANYSIEENEKEKEMDLLPDDCCGEVKQMLHVWMSDSSLKCDEKIESSAEEPTQSCTSERLNTEIKDKAEQKILELVDELEFNPDEEEVEEESETNCSEEANEEEAEIKHQSDNKPAYILNMLNVSSSTEEAAVCCKTEIILNDETRKNYQQFVVENTDLVVEQNNTYHKDLCAGNSSLQRISNGSLSCSSDTCTFTSNSSVVNSKHHRSQRKKVLHKLQKMFLGKHNEHHKSKSSGKKTPLSSASSDTTECVSTSCSDDNDARRNLLCDGDISGFPQHHDSTKHLLETKSSSKRWQSNTAWCHSFFRSSFEVSRTKVFALRDEHMKKW